MGEKADATLLLGEIERGDERAADRLLPLVYDELRKLAENLMRGERRGHTLQPTALVHEAYLRLVDKDRVDWKGKTHFFAIAAREMRRILKQIARERMRLKRGGGWRRITLHEGLLVAKTSEFDTEEILEALESLKDCGERKVRVVEMKIFAGMTHQEIAHVLGVTTRTVERDWRFARAWLVSKLGHG